MQETLFNTTTPVYIQSKTVFYYNQVSPFNLYYFSVSGCARDDVYWFRIFDDLLEALRLQRRCFELSHCCNYPTMGNSLPRVLAHGKRQSPY